ncbi:MAG TPA: lipoate--protein ligase family protein [Desulfuromonadaceae bacterium]|nr:lipoate--protein ligase family protein [Desulfuromonadaceae bacterium]
MKSLELTLPSPAENLACDEALLDWCEETGGDEILRFWESPEYFVVVGYANKISTEVNVPACATRKIPVYRRCSGGGTVIQGPGCLSYALILRIEDKSPLAGITTANHFIMEKNRQAIQSLFPGSQTPDPRPDITVRGHTDLALATRHPSPAALQKFSGNSQRRRKNHLLFHGTFLLDFDLKLAGECLNMPSKQPDYRSDRSHDDFITNLNLSVENVKTAMKKVWQAETTLKNPPLEKLSALAREKYSTQEWNWKF